MANPTRMQKARSLADGGFVKVAKLDDANRVVEATVPGSQSHLYHVVIRRNGKITVDCRLDTGGGLIACKANAGGSVCYHAIAALLVSAKLNGFHLSLTNKHDHATRLLRMGGDVQPIETHDGFVHHPMWAIHRKMMTMVKAGSV